jgi:hypothetical protein
MLSPQFRLEAVRLLVVKIIVHNWNFPSTDLDAEVGIFETYCATDSGMQGRFAGSSFRIRSANWGLSSGMAITLSRIFLITQGGESAFSIVSCCPRCREYFLNCLLPFRRTSESFQAPSRWVLDCLSIFPKGRGEMVREPGNDESYISSPSQRCVKMPALRAIPDSNAFLGFSRRLDKFMTSRVDSRLLTMER